MEIKRKRNVTDIIDAEYLLKIQDGLGKLTKITTAILDTEGVPVMRATNLHSFCEMMQSSESGIGMCMITNAQLIAKNQETRAPSIVTCPNSGLKTAAVPIYLGDEYLGSWLIGQMRTDTIDMQLIEETSMRAGLSAEDAKANIARLPVISEEEFNSILAFVDILTKELTFLVKANDDLNVTNKQLTELSERLNQSARAFREFIDLTDVGSYVTDYHTGELLMVNGTYAKLCGKSSEELVGTPCYEHMGFDTWCSFCPRKQLVDESGEPKSAYAWENLHPMSNKWLSITNRAIPWVDGRLAHMVSFIDITKRKLQEKELEFIAFYDQRLRLPNGAKLYVDVNANTGNAQHLICFDIQGLRKINEVYGRESGDQLLLGISKWIQSLEGYDKTLYRVDGDAFALRVSGLDDNAAKALATHIWDRFASPWQLNRGTVMQNMFVRLSIGIIPCQSGYDSYAELLDDVERILAAARERNMPLQYDEKINEEFLYSLRLEVSLKECVLNNMQGFSLNYQPIVEPASGQWVGLEALCRWTSPEFGFVSPAVFINEVEKLGLIDIVGKWVLDEAVAKVKEWGLDKLDGFVLDVNLSPLQMDDYELHNDVTSILAKHDYSAAKLCLEITESAEVHFDDHIMKSLFMLRDKGITLSLDDFGTGYASFSNLGNLPVSVIKTDRSFVNNIEDDKHLQNMFRIIVEYAHSAKMRVIAEGVETEEQMRVLQTTGADLFQGYLFSRPLGADEIAKNLDKFKTA